MDEEDPGYVDKEISLESTKAIRVRSERLSCRTTEVHTMMVGTNLKQMLEYSFQEFRFSNETYAVTPVSTIRRAIMSRPARYFSSSPS